MSNSSYQYGCPKCEYRTPFYRAWQTAWAALRKHRKENGHI